MNVWKKNLVPMLFAFASVASLIPAVVGPVIKGQPLNYTFVAVAIMFHLTCLGWIVFRAPSFRQLGVLVSSLVVRFDARAIDVGGLLVPLLLFTAPLLIVHACEAWFDDLLAVPRLPAGARYTVYVATLYLLVLFGNFGGAEFIYFQF